MTKDSVLSILKQHDGYVSGEMISQKLGLSRMAVSTAVKALRADGYDIASSTRLGYCLKNSPDKLTCGELMSHLGDERMANVVFYEKTDSTNKRVKLLADEGAPAGQTVIANEQTAGRGRKGRSFLSLKDKGIYLSYLLRPTCTPNDLASITAWTAVAVARAVNAVTGLRPDIKWVNDLLLNDRKICGILTELAIEGESATIQSAVIGIGINVNQTPDDFPPELRDKAGSCAMALGHPVSRAQLAAAVVHEMDRLRDAWPDRKEEFLEAYRSFCVTTGKDIRVISGTRSENGRALDIDDNFALIVAFEDGRCETVQSGEVSIRGADSYV